jgi:hypothetical protein
MTLHSFPRKAVGIAPGDSSMMRSFSRLLQTFETVAVVTSPPRRRISARAALTDLAKKQN